MAVILLGLVLWPALASAFTSAFQAAADVTLGAMRFGKGGHASFLSAAPQSHNETRDASWDARVELSIEGVQKRHVVSVNPRRLAYLPLLSFGALIAAAPLRRSRKLTCLSIGSLILALIALASTWIIIAWIFARVPGLVYDLADWERTLLEFSYEAFVTPMGNKFVVPLLLAAALVVWQRARDERQRAASSTPLIAESKPAAPRPSVRAPARVRRKRRRRR